VKGKYQDREVEITEVEFLTRKEDFNEYQLTDGTTLRMKTVVTDVVRVEGELSPDGTPIYQVRSTSIVRVRK